MIPPRSALRRLARLLATGLAAAVVVAGQAAARDTLRDAAQGGEGEPGGAGVIACDGLVALRRLTAAAPDPSDARERLSVHPGCRVVDRAALGVVERRAIIGGAPFECLTPTAGGACVWVMP